MASDPEREKLDELAARIRQAEAAPKPAVAEAPRDNADAVKAGRIGFDFVATIGGCVALGWLVDHELGTEPWGLLAMMFAGFVAGIANVVRALGGYDRTVGWHKKNGKE